MAITDFERIEEAILFLEQNFQRQPSLAEIAEHVHLSEFHFQRLFRRWAGISPKRFLQFLTVEYAKQLLKESTSVLDATYEAGLSSPSRLHDLFIAVEAVTPGEFKRNGIQLEIAYGFHETPFGECLLAVTDRGICCMDFVMNNDRDTSLAKLQHLWSEAQLDEDSHRTGQQMKRVLSNLGGEEPSDLKLLLKGTNFQIQVWQALMRIPVGSVSSYSGIANRIGQPKAARAVGHAIAQNSVAVLIPCHRVIQSIGVVGGYRWGRTRKKALLGWEAARRECQANAADDEHSSLENNAREDLEPCQIN